MAWFHSIRAAITPLVLAAATLVPAAAQQPAPATSPLPVSFTVFFRSTRIGSEQVMVQQTTDGWLIASSSSIGAPINVTSRRVAVQYDANWRPRDLSVEATVRGLQNVWRTKVASGTASSELVVGGLASERSHAVDADAVMLPSPFFGPYEALSARLRTAAAGSTFSVYIAPQGSVSAMVGESSVEVFDTRSGIVRARRTLITMSGPGLPPLETHVWGDESGRLLRVSVPAQALDIIRDDLASVSARRVTVPRAGDETVRVPGNGFLLSATVSKPATPAGPRLPAVVLVGGVDLVDRDEVVTGVPVFGQLASDLADAGFLVLRYDRRGTGQSGGRPEAAGLPEYTEDLRAAVKLMHDRRDVDRNRLAVIGYGDGGPVAMTAAEQDDRVRALVLVSTIGVTGAEANLARVASSLARSNRPEAERVETLALQKRIQQAVVTGKGWEGIEDDVRRQADVPWFKSYLAFDPARVMRDIHQPVLVVHGEEDWQVPASNADRLLELARARKRNVPSDLVKLPGLDRALADGSGGVERRVSPIVGQSIATWLNQALPAGR